MEPIGSYPTFFFILYCKSKEGEISADYPAIMISSLSWLEKKRHRPLILDYVQGLMILHISIVGHRAKSTETVGVPIRA